MRLSHGPLAILLSALMSFVAYGQPKIDHSKIVGPDKCMECHKGEGRVWQNMTHSKSFKKFHKNKDAKKIAKKLGIKRIKKDSTCMSCHYTVQNSKPIAGTSCESCHGAGQDWIKIHNDYGGKDVKKESESADHKKQRIAKAKAAGMIHPSDLYEVASNCYSCHTIPNEDLVNTDLHKAGSDFELVSWSQGEVRHNFVSHGNKKNGEISQDKKRVMYILGRLLDLEYSMRGAAKAKKSGGTFDKAMKARVEAAKGHVKAIADATGDSNVKAALGAGSADAVASAAKAFVQSASGGSLASVDGLIPSSVKGSITN